MERSSEFLESQSSPEARSALSSHMMTLGEKMLEQLQLVATSPEKQVAHAILRSCLGPVKASYLFRTVAHEHTRGLVATLEKAQRSKWSRVLGGNVTTEAWIQSTLPISRGGCALPLASHVALRGAPQGS